MYIDPNLHPGLSCPENGLFQVGIRPHLVGRTGIIVGPETNRDAKSVNGQSTVLGESDRSEHERINTRLLKPLYVPLGEPGAPVTLEPPRSVGQAIKGPLVFSG